MITNPRASLYKIKKHLFKTIDNLGLPIWIIVITAILVNMLWLTVDTAPPAWDEAGHLLLSYDFANIIKNQQWLELLTTSNYYPPLTHFLDIHFIPGKHRSSRS